MKRKVFIVVVAIILVFSMAIPAMAEENENLLITADNFVEISEVQEGELIELPERNSAPLILGVSSIVSAELLSTDDTPLIIDNEMLNSDSERAATWDWWAYDIYSVSHASDEVLPLNTEITFNVRIVNMGTTNSPSTTAQMTLSDKQSGGTHYIRGTFDVAPCEPYSIRNYSYLYQITVVLAQPAGSHTLEVEINPNNSPEADEYPNMVEKMYTWGNSNTIIDPAYFDIRVVDHPDTATLPIGVQTQMEFFVSNNGNTATQHVPVYVVFTDDDLQYSANTDIVLSTIPPGYARRFTASIKFMSSGVKNIMMAVDPYYTIVDHDRDNNIDSKDFTMTGAEPAGMYYGTLGFAYPLPSNWTGYYPRTNHNGNGLDLNAPEGTEIYSVDGGVVSVSGGDTESQRGYFVVVTNDTPDPYNNQPLHTRYLHMVEKPTIKAGQEVALRQPIGKVGKTGMFVGERRNHLHIDFNSSGHINSTVPESAGINPKLFYPYVKFYIDDTERSTELDVDCCDIDIDQMLEDGHYVDCVIIELVGEENYEAWIESTPAGTRTVYKLVEDFDLSWEDLKDVLYEPIYEEYMSNMPK